MRIGEQFAGLRLLANNKVCVTGKKREEGEGFSRGACVECEVEKEGIGVKDSLFASKSIKRVRKSKD